MRLSGFLGAGSATSMTSFFSWTFFMVFIPLCVISYTLVPNKLKKYHLLLASYVFYWLVSGELIIYLLLSTVSIRCFGLWLDRMQSKMKSTFSTVPKEKKKETKKRYIKKQRLIILLAVFLHIGGLLFLKYSAFFTFNINKLFEHFNIPVVLAIPRYLLPIGISFFTLQALSYILDVYHGVIKADRNIGRLALFLGFFPQIVEGPICRYSQTAEQLWNAAPVKYENLTFGLQRFLFGMLKKLVIADRLSPIVIEIFDKYNEYSGAIIALGAVSYTIQLYMDFSGSMDAVIGIAQIFGIRMPENFERPFFSRSISEFWKRWHITLGTWLKDYLFYPIVTAGKMKKLTASARKKIGNHFGPLLAGSIALFCVWICNGLWHGSGWNYIFFGMYHFVLILSGSAITPAVNKINNQLHINADSFLYRLMQMVRTSVLVVIGELFFRANGLRNGFRMFGKMVTGLLPSLPDKQGLINVLIRTGRNSKDLIIVAVTLAAVFAVSVLNEKRISVRDELAKRKILIRWAVFYLLIVYIIIFGAYGAGYKPIDPLYAQF